LTGPWREALPAADVERLDELMQARAESAVRPVGPLLSQSALERICREVVMQWQQGPAPAVSLPPAPGG
jgi:hypothetical protein